MSVGFLPGALGQADRPEAALASWARAYQASELHLVQLLLLA